MLSILGRAVEGEQLIGSVQALAGLKIPTRPWVDWYEHNGACGRGTEAWQAREGTQQQLP